MKEYISLLEKNGIKCTGSLIHVSDIDKAIEVLSKNLEAIAMPEIVGYTDFGLEEMPNNIAVYTKLIKKANKKLLLTLGRYELYISDRHIFMVNTENDENGLKLVYLVQFELGTINGLKSVTQIKLWKTQRYQDVTKISIEGFKLTEYVFFKILLPMAECIATDNMQTDLGRRFWLDRINDALSDNLKVYVANQNTKKFILVNDVGHLNSLNKEIGIWGGSSKQAMRVIITNKDL